MMIRRLFPMVFAVLAAGMTGCGGPLFSLNLFVVDQQTALEQQVLGSYEEIGRDLDSFASVRGVNPDGSLREAPPLTDSKSQALAAMNNRRYNRDDIDLLLGAGIVGEGNNGFLVRREDQVVPGDFPVAADLVPLIVEEENADREVLLRRMIETSPGVGSADRPRVEQILARLNRDLAPEGSPVQEPDGSWSRK